MKLVVHIIIPSVILVFIGSLGRETRDMIGFVHGSLTS
jgi:hypothetical protein